MRLHTRSRARASTRFHTRLRMLLRISATPTLLLEPLRNRNAEHDAENEAYDVDQVEHTRSSRTSAVQPDVVVAPVFELGNDLLGGRGRERDGEVAGGVAQLGDLLDLLVRKHELLRH